MLKIFRQWFARSYQRRRLGRLGESLAAAALTAAGMELLARNFRCQQGELDLVLLDGPEIVFVEVKTRHYHPDYSALDNLSGRQMRRNFRAARSYLQTIGQPGHRARFDLVEIIFHGRRLSEITRTERYLPDLNPESEP